MNKIVVLQGIPASGKTTYALELVKQGYKRVNKDDIRSMIDNGEYSTINEKLVLEIRDMIIDLALINGYDVVVDDTNFSEKHFKQIDLIASINEAEISVKRFDTTLKTCIERDKLRGGGVGEEVIADMYKKYIIPRKSQ